MLKLTTSDERTSWWGTQLGLKSSEWEAFGQDFADKLLALRTLGIDPEEVLPRGEATREGFPEIPPEINSYGKFKTWKIGRPEFKDFDICPDCREEYGREI